MSAITTLPGGPYITGPAYGYPGRPNTKSSDPGNVEHLAEPLRTRVRALIADCPHRGELGLVSGFRDPGRQWDLRAGRVGVGKAWTSPPAGYPVTAVPARWNGSEWVGGSRHQHGLAADLGGTLRAMEWARANRERYGLALTVRSENWHFEADRVDVRTGRLHNNPSAVKKPIPPVPPPKGLTMSEAAKIRTEMKAANGTQNAYIAELGRQISELTKQAEARRSENAFFAQAIRDLADRLDDVMERLEAGS